MRQKLHRYIGLAGLAGVSTLGAQGILDTQLEGDQLRLQVEAPRIEIQTSGDMKNFTTEQDDGGGMSEFMVDVDAVKKFIRAKVTVNGVDFGSAVQPIFPEDTFPNEDRSRPHEIKLDGNTLTMSFPPGTSGLAEDPAFEGGFPIMLDSGMVTLLPTGFPGRFAGQLPEEVVQQTKAELKAGLTRLQGLGDGTVPLFAGRAFAGTMPVPDPATVGDDLALFPFDADGNAGEVAVSSGTPTLGSAAAVTKNKSLVITDLSVVEDPTRTYDPVTSTGTPMGKWTFGFLMQEMANTASTGVDPKDFARRWLMHWQTTQVVNFEVNGDRDPEIKAMVLDPWRNRNISLGRHPWDLREAPFRLTAIVNRVDLRSSAVYGGGDAGELRFVFCVLDLDAGVELPFTVIFEYGVPISGCPAIKAYAKDWWDMGTLPFGGPTDPFNVKLETLTDVVSLANADPSKPNGSAINQVRTNDFLRPDWDLREFVVTTGGSAPNHLIQTTTKQTPQMVHNNTPDLANFINTFEPDILAQAHTVPLTWAGMPFLSGHAEMPSPGFFFDAPGIANNDARHCFSLNTCNGCHAGETGGTPFVHITERPAGIEATLSNFMTGVGMPVPDPVSGVPRFFDDLTRRAADLDFVAHMPCFLIAVSPSVATLSH